MKYKYIQKCKVCGIDTQYAIRDDGEPETEINLCPNHFADLFINTIRRHLAKVLSLSEDDVNASPITEEGFKIGQEMKAYSSNAVHTIVLKRIVSTAHFKPCRTICTMPTFVIMVYKPQTDEHEVISMEVETYDQLFNGIHYGFSVCLEHVE